jgi:hypothetical protein
MFCSGVIECTTIGRSSTKLDIRAEDAVFLFFFAVLPRVRSSAPTCAIERSTRQQLRQFVIFSFSFSFYFLLLF